MVRLATKYVYDQLPNGVVDRIKENGGEKENWKYKWHQSLTPEVGRLHLKINNNRGTIISISKSKSESEFNEDTKKITNGDFNKGIDKMLGYKVDKD